MKLDVTLTACARRTVRCHCLLATDFKFVSGTVVFVDSCSSACIVAARMTAHQFVSVHAAAASCGAHVDPTEVCVTVESSRTSR